jgi:hypothetical protein
MRTLHLASTVPCCYSRKSAQTMRISAKDVFRGGTLPPPSATAWITKEMKPQKSTKGTKVFLTFVPSVPLCG